MSILLEALRKSEKSQHSQEVPSIHADDQSAAVSESLQTGPLVLLLVTALFVSGWFVWRQYQPPVGSYRLPVTLTNASGHTIATKAPVTGEDETTQTTSAKANPERSPRTPVESYQQTVSDVSQPKPDSSEVATDKLTATQTRDDSASQPDSGTVVTNQTDTLEQKKYRPQEPAPISYWELPDAIRTDLPEMKYSVLVYANNPGDRFVLINGQRLGEGGSVLPGLVVKEIRRDGVVFSYRLYQFLVAR